MPPPPCRRAGQRPKLRGRQARALGRERGITVQTTLVDGKVPFEVHCWYADEPGTVCRHAGPGGLDDMRVGRDRAWVKHHSLREVILQRHYGEKRPICQEP